MNGKPGNAAIRILLFAGLREQAGWAERLWPSANAAPSSLTPRAIWPQLGVAVALEDLRVAINQQFADADAPLQGGDELAFLPPISGG